MQGLFRDYIGLYRDYIEIIQGSNGDNGRENGNCYNGGFIRFIGSKEHRPPKP